MPYLSRMKYFLCITGLLLLTSLSRPTLAAPPPLRIGLKEAMDKNIVGVEAKGSGQSYHAKGLHLQVTNKSGSALMLTMDAGLIFKSDDTTRQDLVLAGMELLVLAPYKTGEMDVQTFCAKSHAYPPGAGQPYSKAVMGSEQLAQLAAYIKKNNLFNGLGQSAVWVITNGDRDLSSIYSSSMQFQSQKLVEFMSGLLNLPKPEVYKEYATNTAPGQPAREPKVLRIYAEFELKLPDPKKLTLGIFNEEGRQVQGVFENRPFPGGKIHKFKVDFQAQGAKPGKYYIRLKEGDAVVQEKEFRLE